MADDKNREYGHNPVPPREEKGLQPIKPVSDIPSGVGPKTAGLQPIPPARPTSEGDPGSGGSDKKSD